MARMTELTVHVADWPKVRAQIVELVAERDRARDLAVRLEAELVTVRRERDAARAEVAHRDATMRGGGW